MTELTDNILILRCKARDSDAFRILVESYKKQAYTFAFSYLKNSDDALNVSQEAFIKVWKYIDTFLENRLFRPWLFGIIKNLSINLINKKKNLGEISLDKAMDESGFDIHDTAKDPLHAVVDKETGQQVWKAVFELKDEFREIIILKHFHDLSYSEIAGTLDIPEGTVMSRLYYARIELKRKLEQVIQRG
ncbi:MAG: RNA polymerase sigma factor [Candidatus Latescibacteria bacterium]|jgi:RNA polymerase sigma-70 factor, ECF subfamily|nr:RNA polymerase sigma factor [Candidatus Latescibacterota bacterium]